MKTIRRFILLRRARKLLRHYVAAVFDIADCIEHAELEAPSLKRVRREGVALLRLAGVRP